MSYYKVRRNRADILFSDHIRKKAGWKCESCGKICRIDGIWIAKLEASHYWVRNHWNTRYDEENVYSLCFTCHKRMGEYKREENGEYDLFVKARLGNKKYKNLKLRANMTARRDEKLWLLFVKQLIKDETNPTSK